VAKASVQREIAKLMKQLGTRVAWSVVVIEDRGAMASLMRTVIRGLNMLGAASRISATATVEESLPLLLPHVRAVDGNPISALEFRGAIRRMRERLTCASSVPT
jgi:hypothetical protein